MKSFAKATIITAAVSAGLDGSAVMDKPDKENITLPGKRLQLTYLDGTLERQSRHVSRHPGPQDAEHPCRVVRSRVYRERLIVQADIKSDDEDWLEAFVTAFVLALPGKIANTVGDLVVIEAIKAVRSGFGSRTVEVFKKRSCALHLRFTGMICADRQIPLITDINLIDKLKYKES